MIEIGPSALFDEKAHAYFYQGKRVPSFSWVMRACGLVNDYGSDFAMKRGAAVHRACELLVKGTLDPATVDPRIAGYVEAFKRAREELGFTPDPALVEKPMINPVYLFGVKPDMPGRFNGESVGLIELKSTNSPSAFPRAVKMQTAAQGLTLWPTAYMNARRVAVQLRPDGSYAKEEHEDLDDFDNFLALLKSAMIRLDAGLVKLNEED